MITEGIFEIEMNARFMANVSQIEEVITQKITSEHEHVVTHGRPACRQDRLAVAGGQPLIQESSCDGTA
jgi:hypothetical protein